MKELAKTYDPKQIEDKWYARWEEKGYFTAHAESDKKPFTIVMPPPNITGQLHMGHAMDNTLQDILTRFRRMQGYEALWLPGTDHASIATEAKVVEAMRGEGLTKEMLGREGFLERGVLFAIRAANGRGDRTGEERVGRADGEVVERARAANAKFRQRRTGR